MREIPPALASRFDSTLVATGIAENHRPYFRRWLRFYLDFCQKYQQDSACRSSLTAFDAKLQDKGQQPWKRQQAQQAVALYLTLLTNKDQPHTATETPHHTDAAAIDTTARPTNGWSTVLGQLAID
ncbi:hypothetical protein [Allochromatium palmeri]|uniref:Integrase SAM-like N-terminal domain-containing protein n=1 Tax=Allochromatium palmeri TaxID=231048 RepID=A0A6N8EEP3_9GAMM|nr:hypothetical protein [Allochromatium palmeri]MTW21578.1 hypothetical protein [Allochromatium palmeri]